MKMVKLNELFDISYGTKFDWNKMTEEQNGIAFVSRTSKNNGVVGYVERFNDQDPYPSGTITVSLGGSYVLSSFVQVSEFYTGQNVAVLIPKSSMNIEKKLFYCYCIEKNRYKYSAFGREANKTLKELLVPSLDEIPKIYSQIKIPDFSKKTGKVIESSINLNTKDWKEYSYGELFEIRGGYYNKKPEHLVSGNIPFIGATRENNGITELYSEDDISAFYKDGSMKEDDYDNKIFSGNCITVLNNGASVGYAFYQERDFTCSHDINVLYLKNTEMTEAIAMFLITIIEMEKYRWNYGRKWRPKRMPESIIKLPSKKVSDRFVPDWEYMDRFVKNCRFSKGALETKVDN